MQSKKLKPSSTDTLLCHKIIILRHLIRNALHFLDFASWCKDSATPSSELGGLGVFFGGELRMYTCAYVCRWQIWYWRSNFNKGVVYNNMGHKNCLG